MKRPPDPNHAITAAATALEAEVRRFHDMAEAARRLPLKTQKQVVRAAQAVQDAVAVQALVAERLSALGAALAAGTAMHGADLESLRVTSENVRERHEEISVLLRRFAEVGADARRIQEGIRGDEGRGSEAATDLEAVAEQLSAVADRARSLQTDANATGAEDLAREADGLRQQLLALVNRLRSVARKKPEHGGGGSGRS